MKKWILILSAMVVYTAASSAWQKRSMRKFLDDRDLQRNKRAYADELVKIQSIS